MKNRIIREYLESLKEDKELDYIFPILLDAMGFRIVSTPKNSKGQPQHGKDVVAIGCDMDNKIYRWYFELKGNASKDITTTNFNAQDGVRDSLLEAKDVAYESQSIPRFNELPVKIVFVHNGVLQANAEPAFNGFIKREFKPGEFERWDIEQLTHLFAEHLFEECLFVDDECYSLFKKTLVMLDAPGWNTNDISTIVEIFLRRCPYDAKPNKRKVQKSFAGLNLILAIIYKYCMDSGNLLPAKWSSDIIVLKIWTWILKNKKENCSLYIEKFHNIYNLHISIYESYINKLLPLARSYKGLYHPAGTQSEIICYPLRCYDFLNDLLYYLISTYEIEDENLSSKESTIDILNQLIKSNSGFDLPLLDNHSISLILLTKYIWCQEHALDDLHVKDYYEYICRVCRNVIIRHKQNNMFPELYSNLKEVCASMYKKSSEYVDSSSMFLVVLIEIIARFDMPLLYKELRSEILESKVNLQIPYPIDSEDFEVNFFDHHLHEEMSVETNIELPETVEEFREKFRILYNPVHFRTDEVGFVNLRLLAHIHHKTEFFPDFLDFGFLQQS